MERTEHNELLERIHTLMKEKGITEQQFCDAIRVNKSTYYRWRSGKMSISVPTIKRISEYFGVSIDYLLKGGNETKPNVNS